MRKPEPIDIRTALPGKPKGFLDQFRVFIRSRGLAYAPEKTYLLWAKRLELEWVSCLFLVKICTHQRFSIGTFQRQGLF